MPRFLAAAAALALGALLSPALALDAPRVERIDFKNGRAVVRGMIRGYATHDYVFSVGAGESIKATLASSRAFFNINPPGSETAIFNGSSEGESFSGTAAVSGDYTARVYLMRNEARRKASAAYTLTLRLGTTSATQENGPDFADGLTGGPDNWEVSGVPAGDALNIRATPSPSGQFAARVNNGETLTNLGCKNTRGQRWCRVATEAGVKGWVNGRYLRER